VYLPVLAISICEQSAHDESAHAPGGEHEPVVDSEVLKSPVVLGQGRKKGKVGAVTKPMKVAMSTTRIGLAF